MKGNNILKEAYKRLFFYPKLNSYKRCIEKRTKAQIDLFESAGLEKNRGKVLDCLNIALKKIGLPIYEIELPHKMYSEHLLVFAAIALDQNEQGRVKKILEIGTHNGIAACILSTLFPGADVTTIDLRDDDPLFVNSYHREKEDFRTKFIRDRNTLLDQYEKINFIQTNSLNLIKMNIENQDLVWVDGDHLYPVAACDITNAVRICKTGGIVMCDDILQISDNLTHKDKPSNGLFSTWETLNALDSAGLTETKYFRKRIYSDSEKNISLSRVIT